MRKVMILLGIVAIFLACVVCFKNLIVKSVVTSVASRITGAPVHIDHLALDVLSSTIRVSGFVMNNPSGFPEGILVSCPQIKVIYDRPTLLKHTPHFLLVEIELKEMGLVRNKEGKLNVDSLKTGQQAKSSPPNPMQIDLLILSIGKIVYKDYTIGAEPSVRVYDVNRHRSYKGIPSAQQLTLLVLAEPMKAAAIRDAEIYGAAMVTGVAVLPIAVAATFIGRDSVRQTIDATFEHVYAVSLEVITRMGTITKHDASHGAIGASINGARVSLVLKKDADNKTEIEISARKYLLPKLDIAGGVLYQILDRMQ